VQKALGCLMGALFALVLLSSLIEGLVRLLAHEWPYLVPVVTVLLAIDVVFRRRRRATAEQAEIATITKQVAEVERLRKRSDRAVQVLAADRVVLERKARELDQLRRTTRGEVNFRLLTQRHHASRLLADEWHGHKHQAIGSKRELAAGVRKLEHHLSNAARGTARLRRHAEATRTTVRTLSAGVNQVQQEIARSNNELTRFNQATGKLRDHIHTSCGPRGSRWYENLQERTRQRAG
jgi:chromosome segregation ATPase